MNPVEIRPARQGEAPVLSELALESKAHWGYSRASLEGWKDELRVTPSDLVAKPTYVGTIDGAVAGFYTLAPSADAWELDNLWVAPRFMQRGAGRALVAHALALAFRDGASVVRVDADPNAEAFYLACGAVRCGEVPAPIPGEPGRVRPQLRFERGNRR